jgi:sigma-B regulation protein RsbU (phosphoserine phosphatase)
MRWGTPGLAEKGWDVLGERIAALLGEDAEMRLIPDLTREPLALDRSSLRLPSTSDPSLPRACYLHIPLGVENCPPALIQVFADPEFAADYPQQELMLKTLAAQASVSLSNANSFHSLKVRARLESELSVAHDIQMRFTPMHAPSIPRVDVKGAYLPAHEVGGDYLDYFETEGGDWVMVIADVSGKGIPAALVMTMLRSSVRAQASASGTARPLLCAVNDVISADLGHGSFITASCVVINRAGTRMTFARAGHTPLLARGRLGASEFVCPRGRAFGLSDRAGFASALEEIELPLADGASYLLYTDGLTDARDGQGRMYGTGRLLAAIDNGHESSPNQLLRHVLQDVRTFTQGEPMQDDLTLLALGVKPGG